MLSINKSYILIVLLGAFLLLQNSFASKSYKLPDNSEKRAIEAFELGNYQEALPVFQDLIKLYPDDKKLNYYLGACLIETENYGTEARQALLASVNKKNPGKLYYYLGIAFHANNDFITALDYYSRFVEEAKNKTKKSVDYEKLIKLCEQGNNPFQIVQEEGIAEVASDTIPEEVIAIQDTIVQEAEIIEPFVAIVPAFLIDTVIAFQVNPEIRLMKVDQFKNEEAKAEFVKGWIKKNEMDSIVDFTDNLRNKYVNADEQDKQSLGELILENEQKIIVLNREIPEYDLKAHQLENEYWQHVETGEIEKLYQENKNINDSLEQVRLKLAKRELKQEPDTVIVPVVINPEMEPKELAEEEPADEGVMYKIQIGAFRKEPPEWVQRLFKKLSYIRKISNYTDDGGVTVYTVGELRTYKDALELQKQVRIEGVKDAFVAAYLDGKRIKISEARKLNGE